MNNHNSFVGHFLVAMPSLADPTFNKSVIYICEHGINGAMGILINKPMQINLGHVVQQLGIPMQDDRLFSQPVLMGGPIGQDHGFILYQHAKKKTASNKVIDISASKELLEQIADGKGPENFLVSLGYAGWSSGQLEAEVAHNDWLTVPCDARLIFNAPISQRWRLSLQKLGVEASQMSTLIGHA